MFRPLIIHLAYVYVHTTHISPQLCPVCSPMSGKEKSKGRKFDERRNNEGEEEGRKQEIKEREMEKEGK